MYNNSFIYCPSTSRRLRSILQHLKIFNPNVRWESMARGNDHNSSTAGIIIIGDEILKGQIHDTNSHFLCKRLFSLGVDVQKISVVRDNLEEIAEEVGKFASKYTHVITSGGIGPTHDDITFEGIALAFGEKVIPHPELIKICYQFFGSHHALDSPHLKMAHVPASARLLFGENKPLGKKSSFPLIIVRNVVVFPGVPSLLEKAFILLEDMYKNPATKFFVKEIYCSKDEYSIASYLNTFVGKYQNKIILGSYPEFYHSYYKVKLTLQSENEETLEEGYNYLVKVLNNDSVVYYEPDPVSKVTEKIYGLLSSGTSPLIQSVTHAVQVIEKCFATYKYSEICVGFNGGKDCTALLYLIQAVVKKNFPTIQEPFQAVYIRGTHPFKEVEQFIQQSSNRYNLKMFKLNGNIKNALEQLKSDQPHIKAVIMGTRHTDPYSAKLEAFTNTDSDWPQYMRVNPLLDWLYHDVWTFLRQFYLPYCILYDNGYTSLGNVTDTWPNPSLQTIDDRGKVCFKPAYMLNDPTEERNGRK